MKTRINHNLLSWATLWLLMFTVVSCTDTETTDSRNFALYYSGVTDIGPSMTYNSGTPTYIGPTPSSFTITKVIYKDEDIDARSFTIDENTGVITISNSAELGVGMYKISISCMAGGKTYTFNDAIEVNMLPAVPEGVEAVPSVITIDYTEVQTSKATSQITTDGHHVSITAYSVIQEEGKEYFTVSQSGKISINPNFKGEIPPGIHQVSLKLTTNAGDCIFENAVEFNITSKPLSLTYTPSEGALEIGNGFVSSQPIVKGSLEELTYEIKNMTPATNQIKIDPKTGILSIDPNNTLKIGDKFDLDIMVSNTYGSTNFEKAYTLNVVAFIKPISNFSYTVKDAMQAVKFETSPTSGLIGDAITFSLINDLNGQITIDPQTGEISAVKGHTIPLGTHTVTVKAKNVKSEATANLTLTVKENPYYFTHIRYGNNLGLTPATNYANQFRVFSADELQNLSLTPTTDIKAGVEVEWSVKTKAQMSGTTIDANGKLNFTTSGWKDANSGLIMVTATTGKGTPAEVSMTVPVFFNFASAVAGIKVLYSPFVFQVNPKTGGTSAIPTIEGMSDLTQFAIDYRRSFNFYNFNGPDAHGDGQPSVTNSLMNQVWKKYYETIGSATINTGSKDPMSYFSNNGVNGRTLAMALGYVDAANNNALRINPNQYIGLDGIPANGAMIGQMTFITDGNIGGLGNSKNQIFPIFIWFDEAFESK
ncbi:MAG: surface glycan-binding family protein [Bacteroides sp.]